LRLKLIACKVICREISGLIAKSENYIDVTFIRQGYHNEPAKLNEIIKREIDRIDKRIDTHSCNAQGMDFDAILLGFGLCSNGLVGISSERYQIVVPRAHDCVTLLLGSAKEYRRIFDECSGGVYWYSPGWIENCPMPCEKTSQMKYEMYKEKYGVDNAQFLIHSEELNLRNYKRAAYIDTGFKRDEYAQFTKEAADYFGWEYKEYRGDLSLLSDLINGNWDNDRFLIVPKGTHIAQSYDEKIIRAEKGATIN
jgi:Protein of unknown function (DUF1638).